MEESLKQQYSCQYYDQEWVDLMKEAKRIGLSTKEVHAFFYNQTTQRDSKNQDE